jgi:hypothetical protein
LDGPAGRPSEFVRKIGKFPHGGAIQRSSNSFSHKKLKDES